MTQICPEDKIIVAMDGLNIDDSILLLNKCPKIKWVKVGLELFSSNGPDVIKIFKDMNKNIFLDLKFHDIPNTMRSACYKVSKLGVDMISLHAFAGSKALKISKKATLEGSREMNLEPPLVLGITVLTSFSVNDFQNELNISSSIEENVIRLAKLSSNSDLDGCVCSPWEVKKLRNEHDKNFQLITPGIRLNNYNHHDQNRVMTPYEALNNGASKIVVGRSITKENDPNKVFLEICNCIS